jgi:TetR/AcrR family transcriptional regulator, cholesterol catabolism regulator
MPDRAPQRTYDPEGTREALVLAAVQLFGREGFHGTSVKELVDAAHLTKGAFYHHFESKEEILRVIHDEFLDSHLERQELIVSSFAGAHERLFHLMRLVVFVVAEYQPYVEIFFRERNVLDAERYPDVHEKRDRAMRAYTDTVRAGMESGEFRSDIDPTLATLGVFGMCNWTYQWYQSPGRWTADDIGVAFASMALNGISAKPKLVKAVTGAPIPDPDPARPDTVPGGRDR